MPRTTVTPRRDRRRATALGAVLAAGAVLVAGPTAQALGSTTHPTTAAAKTQASSASTARALTPAVRAQLDRAITQVMQQTKTPGVTVGVTIPGKGTYTRAFGTAQKNTRTPMHPGFNMRVGSLTKTFTATAVLQLVDQKKVRLDDPISRYVRGVPQGRHITLRHLMEMRSGLFEYLADEDWIKAYVADPHRQWTADELLSYALRHPAQAAPGSTFQYVNTNYLLLGKVVEKVSGQSLSRYLNHHILTPTHLKHTFYPKGAEFPAPHAHGYTDQTSDGSVVDATDWSPSSAGAAGAMISNLSDLQRWAPMLAKGTLLKHGTQAQRMKMLPTGAPGVGYGLGVFNNHGWIGHNGSLPGYQSLMVYLPAAKATLIVHTTSDVRYQGQSPSTLFGKAITNIVTPKNVFDIQPPKPESVAPRH